MAEDPTDHPGEGPDRGPAPEGATGAEPADGDVAPGESEDLFGALREAAHDDPGLVGEKRMARLRRTIDARRARGLAMLEEWRPRSSLLDAGVRTWERDVRVGGPVLAGAVAFRFFLFIVPFSFVLVSVAGVSARVAHQSSGDLARKAGVTGLVAKAISSTGSVSTTGQVLIMLTALYALLSTSRSLVRVLFLVEALIWQVPRVKPKGMLPALTAIGTMLASAVITNALDKVRNAAPAPGLALTLAWALAPLALAWWVFAKLPRRDAPIWALLPGAVLMMIGLQAMHLFTVYWVAREVSSKSETYGTVGVALSILAWAYLIGRLFVGSSALNATLWDRYLEREGKRALARGHEPPADAGRRATLISWIRSAGGLLR